MVIIITIVYIVYLYSLQCYWVTGMGYWTLCTGGVVVDLLEQQQRAPSSIPFPDQHRPHKSYPRFTFNRT